MDAESLRKKRKKEILRESAFICGWKEGMMPEPNFYLLTYDISDDRRRTKIARELEAVAERVQHSVFEAHLMPAELEKLVKRTLKHLKKEEDSLRVYVLCQSCRGKIKTWGQGRVTSPPDLVVL